MKFFEKLMSGVSRLAFVVGILGLSAAATAAAAKESPIVDGYNQRFDGDLDGAYLKSFGRGRVIDVGGTTVAPPNTHFVRFFKNFVDRHGYKHRQFTIESGDGAKTTLRRGEILIALQKAKHAATPDIVAAPIATSSIDVAPIAGGLAAAIAAAAIDNNHHDNKYFAFLSTTEVTKTTVKTIVEHKIEKPVKFHPVETQPKTVVLTPAEMCTPCDHLVAGQTNVRLDLLNNTATYVNVISQNANGTWNVTSAQKGLSNAELDGLLNNVVANKMYTYAPVTIAAGSIGTTFAQNAGGITPTYLQGLTVGTSVTKSVEMSGGGSVNLTFTPNKDGSMTVTQGSVKVTTFDSLLSANGFKVSNASYASNGIGKQGTPSFNPGIQQPKSGIAAPKMNVGGAGLTAVHPLPPVINAGTSPTAAWGNKGLKGVSNNSGNSTASMTPPPVAPVVVPTTTTTGVTPSVLTGATSSAVGNVYTFAQAASYITSASQQYINGLSSTLNMPTVNVVLNNGTVVAIQVDTVNKEIQGATGISGASATASGDLGGVFTAALAATTPTTTAAVNPPKSTAPNAKSATTPNTKGTPVVAGATPPASPTKGKTAHVAGGQNSNVSKSAFADHMASKANFNKAQENVSKGIAGLSKGAQDTASMLSARMKEMADQMKMAKKLSTKTGSAPIADRFAHAKHDVTRQAGEGSFKFGNQYFATFTQESVQTSVTKINYAQSLAVSYLSNIMSTPHHGTGYKLERILNSRPARFFEGFAAGFGVVKIGEAVISAVVQPSENGAAPRVGLDVNIPNDLLSGWGSEPVVAQTEAGRPGNDNYAPAPAQQALVTK